ncbi:MAG: DUF1822 family protein [Crocinitomicaceae bacterium]|nr:DUF1822 family protein [Crocinitomicaceae bacterium]
MNLEEALKYIEEAVLEKTGQTLSNAQKELIQGIWQGMTYRDIANASSDFSENYLMRDIGPNFFRLLSVVFGENVSKTNLKALIERRRLRSQAEEVPRTKESYSPSLELNGSTKKLSLHELEAFLNSLRERQERLERVERIGGPELSSEQLKLNCARNLWKIAPGSPEAIATALELLGSQDKNIRIQAASFLEQIGERKGLLVIEKCIESSHDPQILIQSAKELGTIGSGNPKAVKLLMDLYSKYSDQKIKFQVIESLGQIALGNPDAVEFLKEQLDLLHPEEQKSQPESIEDNEISSMNQTISTKDGEDVFEEGKKVGKVSPLGVSQIKPFKLSILFHKGVPQDSDWELNYLSQGLPQNSASDEYEDQENKYAILSGNDTDSPKFNRASVSKIINLGDIKVKLCIELEEKQPENLKIDFIVMVIGNKYLPPDFSASLFDSDGNKRQEEKSSEETTQLSSLKIKGQRNECFSLKLIYNEAIATESFVI